MSSINLPADEVEIGATGVLYTKDGNTHMKGITIEEDVLESQTMPINLGDRRYLERRYTTDTAQLLELEFQDTPIRITMEVTGKNASSYGSWSRYWIVSSVGIDSGMSTYDGNERPKPRLEGEIDGGNFIARISSRTSITDFSVYVRIMR